MAPIPGQDHIVRLHLKCWLYAQPRKLSSYHTALAHYLRAQSPAEGCRWVIADALDRGLARPGAKRGFLAIEAMIALDLSGLNNCAEDEEELYDELFELVSSAIHDNPSFVSAVGLESHDRVVFWSLFEMGRAHKNRFSRWMVMRPRKSCQAPAERLAAVLNSLTAMNPGEDDNSHDKCGSAAALGCIEFQLREHNLLVAQLVDCINILINEPSTEEVVGLVNSYILEMVATFDDIHRNFGGLNDLLDQVAVLPLASKLRKSVLRRLLRRLLVFLALRRREKKTAKTVEDLKRRARLDAAQLRRRMYAPVAHARLRNPADLNDLLAACSAAPNGAERREMTVNFAMEPSTLGDPAARARNFERVTKHYIEEHVRVLADLDVLFEAIGLNDRRRKHFEGCKLAEGVVDGRIIMGQGDSDEELWDEKV